MLGFIGGLRGPELLIILFMLMIFVGIPLAIVWIVVNQSKNRPVQSQPYSPLSDSGIRVSEKSEGPGWWLASDGKWYPPESRLPPPPAPPPPGDQTHTDSS